MPGAHEGAVQFELDNAFAGSSAVFIDGWAFSQAASRPGTPAGRTYVVLRSEEREYVFDTSSRKRPDLGEYFRDRRLDGAGFFSYIPVSGLEHGVYKVGLYIADGVQGGFILTDEEISI